MPQVEQNGGGLSRLAVVSVWASSAQGEEGPGSYHSRVPVVSVIGFVIEWGQAER